MVYVTSPVKAVEGILLVDHVIENHPAELWGFVEKSAGVSLEEFNEYFDGAEFGFGIFLKEARRIKNPISLEKLRKTLVKFQPPQSYRYLRPNEIEIYGNL